MIGDIYARRRGWQWTHRPHAAVLRTEVCLPELSRAAALALAPALPRSDIMVVYPTGHVAAHA